MKICYLADADSIHVQRWINYFADQGFSVHVISFKPLGSQIKKHHSVKVHLIGDLTVNMKLYSRLIDRFSTLTYVRKLVAKIQPDILHAHSATIYALMGALTGVHPFLISVWGSDVLNLEEKSRMRKLIVFYSLKSADCITTTAGFMNKYLVDNFCLLKGQIICVPWGVDLEVFHQGYGEEVEACRAALRLKLDSPVVLSSRHMVSVYMIENIIETIPYVLKSHPNVVFIFLKGSGSSIFEEEMRLKALKLGVADNTRFISRLLTPTDMAIYYNMADAAISIPKYGQFGASILEGMICGASPIASDIPVHREVLRHGENALLVDADDPRKIAEAIIRCVDHPEMKHQFYKRNKKIIEESWSWQMNAGKMKKIYEKFVEIG